MMKSAKVLFNLIVCLAIFLLVILPLTLFIGIIIGGDPPPENSINFNEKSVQDLSLESQSMLSDLIMLGVDTRFSKEQQKKLIAWVGMGAKDGLTDTEQKMMRDWIKIGIASGLEQDDYIKLVMLVRKGISNSSEN